MAGVPRSWRRGTGYLAVHSVEKSFGTRQVVRGVSIYVRRGEAVGLLGPNGAGKTTGILHDHRPDQGGSRRDRA
jgi:lipopolysaccharide export system ATP-binding protein